MVPNILLGCYLHNLNLNASILPSLSLKIHLLFKIKIEPTTSFVTKSQLPYFYIILPNQTLAIPPITLQLSYSTFLSLTKPSSQKIFVINGYSKIHIKFIYFNKT